ncbi:MAG: hypothetical protein Q7S83_02390 [bacterium]|nr:hypothetical protein [bacterium]
MNLLRFIKELEKIAKSVERPEKVEVQMADTIPVVEPLLIEGVVYISDQK